MNLNTVLVNSHTLTDEQHASRRTAGTELISCLLISLFLHTHGTRLTFFSEPSLGPHLYALRIDCSSLSLSLDVSHAGPFCISPSGLAKTSMRKPRQKACIAWPFMLSAASPHSYIVSPLTTWVLPSPKCQKNLKLTGKPG